MKKPTTEGNGANEDFVRSVDFGWNPAGTALGWDCNWKN
jgi:hypothetical protein